MSSIMAKIVGSRGRMVTRQSTKDVGMTASVQTFTSIVTMKWDWDHITRTWKVSIYRNPIIHGGKAEREVLWEGAVAE